jgi:hypothetical protein
MINLLQDTPYANTQGCTGVLQSPTQIVPVSGCTQIKISGMVRSSTGGGIAADNNLFPPPGYPGDDTGRIAWVSGHNGLYDIWNSQEKQFAFGFAGNFPQGLEFCLCIRIFEQDKHLAFRHILIEYL